jgi:uncharacterized phage-like protein YoqJ
MEQLFGSSVPALIGALRFAGARTGMKQADLVRFICPSYSRDCFQRRNEWMVDHAARVIAVYNGESGGTRNTVAYAKRNGVPVVNVLLKSNSDIFIK